MAPFLDKQGKTPIGNVMNHFFPSTSKEMSLFSIQGTLDTLEAIELYSMYFFFVIQGTFF